MPELIRVSCPVLICLISMSLQERLPGAKYPDSKPSTSHGRPGPAPRSGNPSEPVTARGGGGRGGGVAQSLDDALWQHAARGGDKENRGRPAGGGGGGDYYGGGAAAGGCGVRLMPVARPGSNDGRRPPPQDRVAAVAGAGGFRKL